MVTHEEWEQQKRKDKEQDEFIRRWMQHEAKAGKDTSLLCPKCQEGIPDHKAAYFCRKCMLEMQIVIDYSYDSRGVKYKRDWSMGKMTDV